MEHIMPESIGSRRRILRPGIVCDSCNNYFAVKIERPLLSHPWMRNVRAWQQVPSKKGKYPSLFGHIAGTPLAVNLRRSEDGRFKIAAENQNDAQLVDHMVAGLSRSVLFKFEEDPPPVEMSRFLCKMALEAYAEIIAKDAPTLESMVVEPYFERIREFARYGRGAKQWPYSQRRVFPHDTLMRHPESKKWVQAGFGCCLFLTRQRETFFAFGFYGVEFVINVGGPSLDGFEQWLQENKGISPLVERLGCRLTTKREGERTHHYLHGTFEAKRGIEFDLKNGYPLL